ESLCRDGDRGKGSKQLFHRNQAGIRDPGSGLRWVQRIERNGLVNRELAASRPPERFEAGARADALAEVANQRPYVETSGTGQGDAAPVVSGLEQCQPR